MYRQRPWGGILTGAVFLFGGILLKDIKTKEHHAGAELPKTLRHAPKELARKGLLAAKEKGKEQLNCVDAAFTEIEQTALQGFTAAEQQALCAYLLRIHKNFESKA